MSEIDAVRALARVSRVLESASGELSLAHYRVLAAVADGDERASRLAARLALGKPAISSSVDALCKRGLLTREDVQSDQRASTLCLTPAGHRVLHAAETAMTEALHAVIAATPRGDSAAAALARLGSGLDRLADERFATR